MNWNKKVTDNAEIKFRIKKGRQIIKSLNGIVWSQKNEK